MNQGFGDGDESAVGIGAQGVEDDSFSAETGPMELGGVGADGGSGIVELENLAVCLALPAHGVGTLLAEADSVAFSGTSEEDVGAGVFYGIEFTADGVPAENSAEGEAEGRSGDELAV